MLEPAPGPAAAGPSSPRRGPPPSPRAPRAPPRSPPGLMKCPHGRPPQALPNGSYLAVHHPTWPCNPHTFFRRPIRFFRRPIRATSSLLLLSRATPAPLVATHRTEPCRTPDHHPTLGRSLRDDPSLPPTPVPALAVAGSRTRMEIARCATSTPFPARSAWSRPRCVPA